MYLYTIVYKCIQLYTIVYDCKYTNVYNCLYIILNSRLGIQNYIYSGNPGVGEGNLVISRDSGISEGIRHVWKWWTVLGNQWRIGVRGEVFGAESGHEFARALRTLRGEDVN